MITRKNNIQHRLLNVYVGQSSEGFLFDHHLPLSKRRDDIDLYWDIVENNLSVLD